MDCRCASEEEPQGVPSSLKLRHRRAQVSLAVLKGCMSRTAQWFDALSFDQNMMHMLLKLWCFDLWQVQTSSMPRHTCTASAHSISLQSHGITNWSLSRTCNILCMITKPWLYMLHCAWPLSWFLWNPRYAWFLFGGVTGWLPISFEQKSL